MFSALLRKGRQVAGDPVLRRWMLRRALGREKPPATFTVGRPPYLSDIDIVPATGPRWTGENGRHAFSPPTAPLRLALAGETVEVSPDDPGAPFARSYADIETLLSAHRFAWVPLAGDDVDPDWVAALWNAWIARHGGETGGWPWHAYTAAERAINIIDFARRYGLPGERDATVSLLAKHAAAIARALEYFGDHYTSNHLSNNGRGLLRIGSALDLPEYAALGARIMLAEAARIFGRSGVLREGSTHYHMLLTRNYVDAWLEAKQAGLPEAATLRSIAERALGVLPVLRLPGGLPLIGDISPDCPPGWLEPLANGEGDGWSSILPPEKKEDLQRLLSSSGSISPDRAAEDGWHRFGGYGWTALAFVPRDGWVPMPGHGHQDATGFEIHFGGMPLLTDPGRGSYRDAAEDRKYISAAVHNGLSVDGCDPAPPNRPYYGHAFRTAVAGAAPEMKRTRSGQRLTHAGYSRLRGVGALTREWRFGPAETAIADRLDGGGTHTVRRQFCTPHPVERTENGFEIQTPDGRFLLEPGGAARMEEITCWTAYGEGRPGTLIVSETKTGLPFDATATLRRL